VMKVIARTLLCLGCLMVSGNSFLLAQQMPPAPVRYTEAIEQPVQKTVELTGSVDSRDASFVASEVSGVVLSIVAREGEFVGKGAPIVQLRRDSLELRVQAAKGELDEAKASLRLAEMSVERATRLRDENVLSQEGLDSATTSLDAGRGRVARLGADLKRLEYDLSRSTIRSPYAGVVVNEMTAPGSWVNAGTPVAEMIDLEVLEITIAAPAKYYSGIKNGSKVRITVDALDGAEFEGTVRALVPRANPQARTFPVKISVPNGSRRIGAGMLAQVVVPVGKGSNGILVPKDAVVSQGPSRMVFRIGGDNAVQPVPVEIGLSQGAWIEVRGDLQKGDKVVTRGNERLRPGQTVLPELLTYEMP